MLAVQAEKKGVLTGKSSCKDAFSPDKYLYFTGIGSTYAF